MIPLATFSFDTPGDTERAAELRRVKALATLVLVSTLALFVIAKWLLPVHPMFGFIAAFAEAATIGGLADWYAVVALFKRPLGLPIPHTAIIQSNQARIADKLGEFIQVHFLEAGPVEAKLKEIDFGSFVADWLRDRKRSDDLARFALRLLPEAVSATETSGLMTFIIRRMSSQLQAIDLAPLAAGTLRGFVALEMGDWETAERDAQSVLTTVEPHNPQAPAQVAPRVLLALARLADGDSATAVGLLAPVATAAANTPSLLFSRRQTMARYASALLAHGQREQALDWAQRAVAVPAEDVRSQVIGACVLAEALDACGRRAEALASAREAVRLAYSTEQRSERAVAEALHARFTTGGR
jgi:hypothetical protein